MTTDPNNESSIDLSVEEQAAIDEQAREATEAAQAAANPEPPADPEPAPAAPEPATPDPVLAALAENTAATRALAEATAAARAEPAAPAAPAEPAPVPRDFDAEFAALQQKFDDGDMDAGEHATALRKLTLDEAEARTAAQIAKAQADAAEAARLASEKTAADAKAAADAAFNAAQTAFFADPGNAALIDNNIKRAGFQAAVQEAFAEDPAAGPEAWLVKAREKITGIAAVDTTAAINKAKFERQQQVGQPAVTLREVPNAGNPGSEPGAALDNLPIDQLEDALAAMPEADRNKYLAGAPGNAALAA